jgi:excisionase family DNA binding protein
MTIIKALPKPQSATPKSVAKPFFIVKPQYSKEQAAKILGFSLGTLAGYIAEKQITVIRVGRRDSITLEALLQFMSIRLSQGGVQ